MGIIYVLVYLPEIHNILSFMFGKGVINRLCHGKRKSHRDVTNGSWKCSLYQYMNVGCFTWPVCTLVVL